MRAGTGLEGESKGYTVLEVIIFLAVSGFMFLIAASFISGKQASAEFRQGVTDLNTQLNAIINDVGNGYYPSNNDFSCSAGLNGPPVINTSQASAKNQGENKGCVFLGKVVQFGTAANNGSDQTSYTVYTVAGRQFASGSPNNTPASFSEALPKVVDNNVMVDNRTLQWGAQVNAMYDGSAANPIGAIGFFGSFGGGSLSTGSQTILALKLPDSALAQQKSATISQIEDAADLDATLAAKPNPNVIICLKGGSSHYGQITIGGNGQRLTTNMQINKGSPVGICPA